MESRFSRLVIDALFPRFCLNCNREGSLWCERCDAFWQPTPPVASCPFCGDRGSFRTCHTCASETFLDGITVFASYANPVVREALSVWKYTTDLAIEPVIERWLSRAMNRFHPPLVPYVSAGVPLHLTRMRARGFDQAERLAVWASQLFRIPYEPLLRRRFKTSARAQTASSERKLGELDGLFELCMDREDVPEHVLLCDDVFTSGATMDAAARCFKEAGVKTVWGFVIAKGA